MDTSGSRTIPELKEDISGDVWPCGWSLDSQQKDPGWNLTCYFMCKVLYLCLLPLQMGLKVKLHAYLVWKHLSYAKINLLFSCGVKYWLSLGITAVGAAIFTVKLLCRVYVRLVYIDMQDKLPKGSFAFILEQQLYCSTLKCYSAYKLVNEAVNSFPELILVY